MNNLKNNVNQKFLLNLWNEKFSGHLTEIPEAWGDDKIVTMMKEVGTEALKTFKEDRPIIGRCYRANGVEFDVYPETADEIFRLEQYKSIVKGLVQFMYLEDGRMMVFNENGRLDQLQENEKATIILNANYPTSDYPMSNPQSIVGDVLVLEPESHVRQELMEILIEDAE